MEPVMHPTRNEPQDRMADHNDRRHEIAHARTGWDERKKALYESGIVDTW